jgi:predicted dithiol-disulfide oxidoreductase (DUF899 family)
VEKLNRQEDPHRKQGGWTSRCGGHLGGRNLPAAQNLHPRLSGFRPGGDQRAHWNRATLVTRTVRVPVVLLKSERQKMSTQTWKSDMEIPKVVSPQEWEAARQRLLVKEKESTRARDALAAERRRMPWLAVEKEYEFEGPKGKASLLDLFDGRRQLIVYRAFFEPGVKGWPEHACIGCSMVADQVAHPAHLNARDTTLVFASRASQKDIKSLKARMGWELIPWYTLTDDFDKDFDVDEWHGTNAFVRDGDKVFRTYFINNRGDEQMGSTWNYLDLTALGRQEKWEDSPEGYPKTPPYEWWIWHDGYDDHRRT